MLPWQQQRTPPSTTSYFTADTSGCGDSHVITHYCIANIRSLSELITENADYLVNSVALHLRSSTHTDALYVLQAVLSHG